MRVAASQHLGPRTRQNDSYFHGSVFAAIADGVGDTAEARAAADVAVDYYAELAHNPDRERTGWIARVLLDAPAEIATRLGDMKNPCSTTAAAVLLDENDVLWTSTIGDSRAFIFREGTVIFASTPHNRAAQIRLEQPGATIPPSSNAILTRSLSACTVHLPDLSFLTIRAGDVIVLVTDGVDGTIGVEGICDAIRHGNGDPDFAERRLMSATAGQGLLDNATCIVGVVRDRTDDR